MNQDQIPKSSLSFSAEYYRQLHLYAGIGTWRVDIESGQHQRDAGANAILGLPAQDTCIEVEDYFKRVHPDDEQRVREFWAEAVQTGKRYEIENRIVRPNGEVRWVTDRGELLRDASGKPRFIVGALIDITEKQHDQEALLVSERQLQALFESSPHAIFTIDPESLKILDLNENAVNLTGFERDELTNMRIYHLEASMTKERAESIAVEIEKCGSYQSESQWLSRTGEVVDILITATQIAFAGSKLILSTVQNVTKKRCAERVLMEAERRQRVALLGAGVVHWEWNVAMDRVQWGEDYGWMFGLKDDERITNFREFIKVVHADDRLWLERKVAKTLTRQSRFDEEFRVVLQKGGVRWLCVKAKVFARGSELRMAGVVVDVTDQKNAEYALRRSEEQLKSALRVADMGLWELNSKTGTLSWDERCCEFFGLPNKKKVRLVDVLTRIHSRDRSRLRQEMTKVLGAGAAADFDICYRVLTESDEYIWLRSVGGVVDVARGAPSQRLRVVGITMDITKQKESEEQLKHAKMLAEAASKSKSEFLANMSHEIRTPMTAILGFAELLEYQMTDAASRSYLATIRRNGRYLIELISDILDLSKIEAGRLRLDRQKTATLELIQEVSSLMQVRADEKKLPFNVRFEGFIPEFIDTDPTRVRQILVNLLGNAIKFTEKGSVELVVKSYNWDQKIVFEVVDTGIGMKPDVLNQIFNPFSQGDSSLTRKYGGSGLGLAISKRLCDLLGGKIFVESKLGSGSTFTITLNTGPLHQIRMIPGHLPAPKPVKAGEAALPALKGRVLVVEDRMSVQQLLVRIIESNGGTVVTANNGLEALEKVRLCRESQEPVDLVLMDMQMPILDGFAATKRLRSLGFKKPIIALTSFAMKGDRDRCLKAGCDTYTTKPIEIRTLTTLIREYLCKSKALHDVVEEPRSTASSSMKVLVVDDSEDVLACVEMNLRKRGYVVEIATDGKSAKQVFQRFRPDAIIIDVELKDMKGYELLQDLQRLPSFGRTISIALTGHSAEELKAISKAAGFDHHFVKPPNYEELHQFLCSIKSFREGEFKKKML